MSQLNFQQIQPIISQIKPKIDIVFDIEDLFDLCICNHLDTGHYYCFGKCYYEGCSCSRFEQIEFSITISILRLDIFRFETNNEKLEDDPNLWLEYDRWRTDNATKDF